MSKHGSLISLAAALCIGLFAFAFFAAPRSCEWGLSAYFWSGVGVVAALLALPLALPGERPLQQRILLSLGLGGVGVMVWAGGLFAANVRIICRLF